MATIGKCCFVLPLRTAVIVIGFTSMVISFSGIVLSISSVMHHIPEPKDPLLNWLLEVCFCKGVLGIVYHTILFLVSTILACGALADIPPLLVPWLGWSPFVITGILVMMIMVIISRPDLALPIISFCMMLFLFIIYGTLVVSAYYREMMSSTVQIRVFNLRTGELPKIVEVPQKFYTRYNRSRDAAEIQDLSTPSTSSARPLHDSGSQRSDRRQKLINAYTRFVVATQWPSKASQTPQRGPTDSDTI